MNDQEKQEKAVQYFVVEGIMTRMDMAMDRLKESSADSLAKMSATVKEMSMNNKRMLIALVTVCVTLVFAIVIFVVGYTINNNNWIRYVEQLEPQATEEATNAPYHVSRVHQFGNQSYHSREDS